MSLAFSILLVAWMAMLAVVALFSRRFAGWVCAIGSEDPAFQTEEAKKMLVSRNVCAFGFLMLLTCSILLAGAASAPAGDGLLADPFVMSVTVFAGVVLTGIAALYGIIAMMLQRRLLRIRRVRSLHP